jgi:hypothetical protein
MAAQYDCPDSMALLLSYGASFDIVSDEMVKVSGFQIVLLKDGCVIFYIEIWGGYLILRGGSKRLQRDYQSDNSTIVKRFQINY